jgi:putative N-acetylmannosamine-6-phosphate epimerase
MTLSALLARFRACPLVASVQASEGSPCGHPETLLRLAKASLKQGVRVLRLEGVKTVRALEPELKVPIIGLLKRTYPESEVYITPTAQDADSMIDLGCEVIAIDGTNRPRPGRDDLAALIKHIQRRKVLVMADCDSLESAIRAAALGADVIGTTLAGYTSAHVATNGPDLELLRQIIANVKVPVIAEGRFSQRWEVEAAMRIGATAVTVGGAINDPVKQTRALMPTPKLGEDARIGAVDIGGTWLRFGVFDGRGTLLGEPVRTPNPGNQVECLQWIRERIAEFKVTRVGVGTGGIVDPNTGEVWTAKEHLMPDHTGIRFHEATLGITTKAYGDGHATAWGHANLPQFAGRRVATLALGTGVGAGFVQQGTIWAGRRGEYPRINDLPSPDGRSYETVLGGINLTSTPSEDDQAVARRALHGAVQAVKDLYFPDDIVIAGSVGLSDWLAEDVAKLELVRSPFGVNAGLHGAAALALYPTW